MTDIQCIHRTGCPKPQVCKQTGHCTSITASQSEFFASLATGQDSPPAPLELPQHVHGSHPTVEAYSLCAITHEDDKPVRLAVPGEHVNCPNCRAVIDACLRTLGLNPPQCSKEQTNFDRWWQGESLESFRRANGVDVPYRPGWGIGFKDSMRQAWMARAALESALERPTDHGQVDRHTEEYFQGIDAGFFSGDAFHNEDALHRFEYFMGRWQREAVNIRELLSEEKAV